MMIKTVLRIDGMMCGMCESHINDAIRREFKVKKVNSSHVKGQSVIISEKPIDEEKLRSAINDTGYKLTGVTVSEEKKGGLLSLFKK